MTTVSVLLPAFNAGNSVDVAVESVLAQTYPGWEIVAVDDASSDDTFERLAAWTRRDARIRVRRNESNRGVTGNWNECLREARGELVVKLDADDAWRPHALEELVAPMADDRVIGSGIRTLLCDENLEPYGAYQSDAAMIEAGIDPYENSIRPTIEWLRIAAWGHQLWNGDAFLVRRRILDEVGGLDERFECGSDTAFLTSILEHDGLFAHRGDVGVLYRVVDGSVSDEARRNGRLSLEGAALQLRTLGRLRVRERLPRPLRMHHAQFWRRWGELSCGASQRSDVPSGRLSALRKIVAETAPPPVGDRALERLREMLSKLPF